MGAQKAGGAVNELILHCPYNTPGRNPETGRVWRDGDEFISEAIAYKHFHGTPGSLMFAIDNRQKPAERFCRTLQCLHPRDGIERRLSALTVFCHGFRTGLQIGVDMSNLQEFCEALALTSAPELTVTLYACSAGADADLDVVDETVTGPGGIGGFADMLCDMLGSMKVRARVLAHATRGHCTRNPYVREFHPDIRRGGDWLVDPIDRRWRLWRQALEGELRFRLPRLSKDEVHAALRV